MPMGKGTYGSQRGRPSKAAKSKKMTPAIVFVHNTASALAFAKSLYCEIREETYKILSTKKSNKEKKEQKC